MTKTDKYKKIFAVVCAVLGTLGMTGYLKGGYFEKFAYSIMSVLVLIGLFFIYRDELTNFTDLKDKATKKHIIFASVMDLIASIFLIMGAELDNYGMTKSGLRGKFIILVKAVLLAFALLPFFSKALRLSQKAVENKGAKPFGDLKPGKAFLFSFIGIFLAWIPIFLAYYPAVMTYDFHRQSQEAIKGFIWFWDYQPLAHTWFIWLSFKVGGLLGSLEAGMAFYSIVQMLALSASFGYAVNLIYRLTKSKIPAIITAVFLAVNPFVSVLSVSATKDVLFTAFFITFLCLFIERTFFATGKKQLIIDILWVVDSVFMCLFRKNAVYAIIVFTVFYVIMVGKGKRVRALIIFLAMSAAGIAAPKGLKLALGTTIESPKIEAYSVICQCIARVGYYHEDDMDEETFAELDRIVGHECWHNYNPKVSDPIKGYAGSANYQTAWKGHMGDVFKTWIKYGFKYPNEYIDATLETVRGFWYLDDRSWADVWYGDEPQRGALTTWNTTVSDAIPNGIAHESKLPWLEKIVDPFVSENGFYKVPVLSTLAKPALFCWVMLWAWLILIRNKRKEGALIAFFTLLYAGTLLLGPIVQERYALPLMAAAPLLLALWGHKGKEDLTNK